MKVLLEIWQLLDRRQRRWFLLLQAVALIMAISTLIGIAAVMPFFSALSDPQFSRRSPALLSMVERMGLDDERSFLVALGCGFIAVVLLANTINLLGSLAMNRFAYRIGNSLCVALFDEYIHRDLLFHVRSNSSALFNNVVWEVNRGITGTLQSVFVLNTNLVTVFLIIASLLVVNPFIAVGTIAGLGVSYAVVYMFARRRLQSNGWRESRYTEERTRVANDGFGAIKELCVLHGQDYFRRRFARACDSISAVAVNTQAIAQSPKYILECFAVGGLVGIALFLIGQGHRSDLWLAQLTFFGFAAYRLLPALQQVFQALVRLRTDRVAFKRIATDLRHAVSNQRRSRCESANPSWRRRPHEEIQLSEVCFRYDADRPFAIQNATLRIRAGSTVGIVGPSGSGKTTLVDLIAGLLGPASGCIEVDGIALDPTNRADWQSTIAYVRQDTYLRDASVAENIALGVEAEHIDGAGVQEAARLARLESFVGTLPNGFEEKLGEHGARLSGGQRQRIGIARALYRNASVIIMDEATNALDTQTEQQILDTLQALRGERTIILVTHRLSAVQRCDIVFEIQTGTIVRSGTYDELMRDSAHFRRSATSS